jgi:hypothetical protein
MGLNEGGKMKGRFSTIVFSLCCFLIMFSLLMAVHISLGTAASYQKDIISESTRSVDQSADNDSENAPETTRIRLAHYEDSFSFQGLRKKMAMVMTVESEEWTVRLI